MQEAEVEPQGAMHPAPRKPSPVEQQQQQRINGCTCEVGDLVAGRKTGSASDAAHTAPVDNDYFSLTAGPRVLPVMAPVSPA